MNIAEVQKRLDALAVAMMAKGMHQPSAHVFLKSQSETSVSLNWKSEREARYGTDSAYEHFSGKSLSAMMDKADKWVAARPEPAEAKLREFMAAVAKAVDLGRENGIEADFVNPLSVLMRTLSENALTYQRTAAE